MTDAQTRREIDDLNQIWDALTGEDLQPVRLSTFSRDIAMLRAADDAIDPPPSFVTRLEMQLRTSRRQHPVAVVRARSRELHMDTTPSWSQASPPIRHRHNQDRRWYAFLAVAAVIVLIAGTLSLRQRWEGSPLSTAAIPAAQVVASPDTSQSAETRFADVPMEGSDSARSNIQPGPGIGVYPAIVAQIDITGDDMILANNLLIVFDGYSTVVALNPETLGQVWKRSFGDGYYGSPVASGNRLILAYSKNPVVWEQHADATALVAISLADGSDIWRTAGGSAFGSGVVVQNDIAYAMSNVDGAIQFGAFRLSDGSQIYQVTLDDVVYCCNGFALAISGKTAIAETAFHLIAFNIADGKQLWATSVPDYEIYQSLTVGEYVVTATSWGDSGAQAALPKTGTINSYSLKTGEEIGKTPNIAAYASGIELESGIGSLQIGTDLTNPARWISVAGPKGGPDLFDPVQLSDPSDTENQYLAVDSAPTIVGQTAYALFSVLDTGDGSTGKSMLTSVDISQDQPAATTNWFALFDGHPSGSPIVSGGRIFVLTTDAGLYVFGNAPTSSATPVATPDGVAPTFDFRTTVTCTVTVISNPLLGPLPDAPAISGATPRAPIDIADVPSGGSAVDPAIADQLAALFTNYRNCSAVDPYNDVFGFFSTDFYVRLKELGPQTYRRWDRPTVGDLDGADRFAAQVGYELALPASRWQDSRIGDRADRCLRHLVRERRWILENRRVPLGVRFIEGATYGLPGNANYIERKYTPGCRRLARFPEQGNDIARFADNPMGQVEPAHDAAWPPPRHPRSNASIRAAPMPRRSV